MSIRLLLADDHPIVLNGLAELFRLEADFEVVGRCRDGTSTLEALRRLRPDVVVLDLAMPRGDGLEVLRAMRDEDLPTRPVVLTAALSDDQLLQAVRLGARGVVLKEMAPRLLLQATREVHLGGEWLERGLGGRALRRLLVRHEALRDASRRLTTRELEVVGLVAGGLRNRAIAERLCVTEGTIKIHLHNVYEKLGIGSRVELALYAQGRGLVESP